MPDYGGSGDLGELAGQISRDIIMTNPEVSFENSLTPTPTLTLTPTLTPTLTLTLR